MILNISSALSGNKIDLLQLRKENDQLHVKCEKLEK